MEQMSSRQHVIVYLSGFESYNPTFELTMPYGMTQDGIASALGLTRGHVSLLAKRLIAAGDVECAKKRITEVQDSVRFIYYLTPRGMSKARDLRRNLPDGPLTPNIAIARGLRGCSENEFRSLPSDERALIGMLCLISRRIYKREIPSKITCLLRYGNGGEVNIDEETRTRYLATASMEEIRGWHSDAADWFTDRHPEDMERLAHLIHGERIREAERFVSDRRYMLMGSSDPDHALMVEMLLQRSQDPVVHTTAAHMAIACGDTAKARSMLETSEYIDREAKLTLLCDIRVMEGDAAGVLSDTIDAYTGDPLGAIAMGRAYIALGNPNGALPFLRHARISMCERSCLYGLDEAYRLEALAMLLLGQNDRALKLLTRAMEAALDSHRKEWIRDMVKALNRARSKHGAGFEGIDIGNVQVSDVLYVPLEHGKPLESESPS